MSIRVNDKKHALKIRPSAFLSLLGLYIILEDYMANIKIACQFIFQKYSEDFLKIESGLYFENRLHAAKYELNGEIKIGGCGENPVGDDTTESRVRAVRQ